MPDLTNWPRAVAQGGKPVLRGSRQACTVRTRSGQPSRAWQAGTPAVRAAIIAAVGPRPRHARLARVSRSDPGHDRGAQTRSRPRGIGQLEDERCDRDQPPSPGPQRDDGTLIRRRPKHPHRLRAKRSRRLPDPRARRMGRS
jgi:hypothetical protein